MYYEYDTLAYPNSVVTVVFICLSNQLEVYGGVIGSEMASLFTYTQVRYMIEGVVRNRGMLCFRNSVGVRWASLRPRWWATEGSIGWWVRMIFAVENLRFRILWLETFTYPNGVTVTISVFAYTIGKSVGDRLNLRWPWLGEVCKLVES